MKYCLYCGQELTDDAVFCRFCGKKLVDGQEEVAQTETAEDVGGVREISEQGSENNGSFAAPDVAQSANVGSDRAVNASQMRPKRKKGETCTKVKNVFERIVCRAIALAACFILFISGFFIAIDFYESDQVQHRIEISSSGDVSITSLMMEIPIEQNVFNVFDALFFQIDGEENKEELAQIEEEILNKSQKIIAKYQKQIAKLSAEADAGSSHAAEKLIDLYYDIVEEICSSMKDINIIKADRLSAEIAYYDADGTGFQQEQAYSLANDLIFRTGLLTLYVAGYVYLQVVSLVYIIISAIDFFRKDQKKGVGKFFLLYLIGCFALFAAGQLTATSVNGVGIFCFIMAAVLGAVYVGCRVFATHKFNQQNIVALSCRGIAAAVSFSALCVLTGSIFNFGVFINKIGAVFGLYAGETNPDYYVDDLYTFGNFMSVAVPYLLTYIFLILVFSKSVAMVWKGESAKAKLVIPILVSAVILASYIALIVVSAVYSVLVHAPEAFLVVFVLSVILLAAYVFEYCMHKEKVKRQRNGAAPIGGNMN